MNERMWNGRTISACLLLLFGLAAPALGAGADAVVKLTVDRESAVYKCGEMATFTVTVTQDGKPVESGEVVVRFVPPGGKGMHEETLLKMEGQPAQFKMTQDKPVYLLSGATYRSADGKTVVMHEPPGLMFDPEKIEPAAVAPKDFDAFWEAARKERDAIPMDLKLDPCAKYSTADADVFIVSVANVWNTRAYGYLSVPKKAKPPIAAHIAVPGAGPGPYWPNPSRQAIVLDASVHAYVPFVGEPSREQINKVYPLPNEEVAGDHSGAPDRKKYYFYRAVLGIDRLIEYVASRPDVDRAHFSIGGGSQGGALALILGGLNGDKFTSITSVSPGMCDLAAYQVGRPTSWPGVIPWEVQKNAAKDPAKELAYREFSAYFDAVNFARRIKCPTIMGTGLRDQTCWAENVYAAYNAIQAPKRIFTDQGGHPSQPRAMYNYHDKEWDEALKKASEEIGRAAASGKSAGK